MKKTGRSSIARLVTLTQAKRDRFARIERLMEGLARDVHALREEVAVVARLTPDEHKVLQIMRAHPELADILAAFLAERPDREN